MIQLFKYDNDIYLRNIQSGKGRAVLPQHDENIDAFWDIGNMLLKGLSPEQSEMLHRITSDPQQAQAFMNSPEVKKILDEQ